MNDAEQPEQNHQPVTVSDIKTLSRIVDLPLPDDRAEQLTRTLSNYLEKSARMRSINVGDAEPPTITFESEAGS